MRGTHLVAPMPTFSSCVLYARKSSESEDRQVLSIDSQIQELRAAAARRGLVISSVFTESRSAKAPGRPVFSSLMEQIAREKPVGILCWKLDRLARNPIDGGALIWAMDQGTIREIVTPGRTFENRGDDKLWMQLEFGMAKKYVDDLSENVKRGNRTKLEQGWLPGLPALGYLNDPGTRTIIRDPERFDTVRHIWDLALERTPLSRILTTVNDTCGFRTRKSRRQGGRPLALSTLYKLLTNPFYYGLIVRNGGSFPGAHPAMITRDEYDRVQEFLGRPNRAGHVRHYFPLAGLIRCGECGLSVTAEVKVNRFGSRYTYYHCTKRRGASRCAQRTIRAEALEAQVLDVLKTITVPESVLSWAARHIEELHTLEKGDQAKRVASAELALRDCETRLSRLTDLRIRDLLADEEYGVKRQELVEEKLRLIRCRDAGVSQDSSWFEPAKQYLSFRVHAANRFQVGTDEDKAAIVRALGSNLTLRDRKLTIHAEKPFLWVEGVPSLPTWQALVERVRTFFTEHPDRIRWPAFCQTERSGHGGRDSVVGEGRHLRS